MNTILEKVADAIDAARYAHPEHPRQRPMPFAQAHPTDREYAFRLARAALKAAEIERLRAALLEAADDIGAWGAYAGEYFQEKHDLPGDIEKYRAIARGDQQTGETK